MDSILTSIKKLLGIMEEDTHFDADIIMHINSVFMVLNQLGVGPSEGFRIKDKYSFWDEFVSDEDKMDEVKSYVYMKVRMIFDPPISSIVAEAMNKAISEFEWRLNLQVESQ